MVSCNLWQLLFVCSLLAAIVGPLCISNIAVPLTGKYMSSAALIRT